MTVYDSRDPKDMDRPVMCAGCGIVLEIFYMTLVPGQGYCCDDCMDAWWSDRRRETARI